MPLSLTRFALDEEIKRLIGSGAHTHAEADVTGLVTDVTNLKAYTSGLIYTPETYGAVGDGVTDDTAAIQAAINAAGAVRGTAECRKKLYKVSPDTNGYCLYMPFDYTALCGVPSGRGGGVKIFTTSTAFKGILSCGAFDATLHTGSEIRDLTFSGPTAASYGTVTLGGLALDLRWAASRLQSVRTEWTNGIKVDSISGATAIDNTYNDVFVYGMLTDAGVGYDFGAGCDNTELIQCKAAGYQVNNTTAQGGSYGFRNQGGHFKAKQCHPYYFKNAGCYLLNCQDAEVDGGEWESNGTTGADGGIQLHNAFRCRVWGMSLYHNAGPGIIVESGSANNVIGMINDISGASPGGSTSARNIYINGGSNNTVMMCANLSGATAQSITLDGNTSHNIIIGNQCAKAITSTSGCTLNRVDGNVVTSGGVNLQVGDSAGTNITT